MKRSDVGSLRSDRKMGIGQLLALCLILLLTAIPVLAALTGDLQGTIFDPKGLPVSQATVTIKNLATGTTRTLSTSDAGEFSSQQLDIGAYEIRIEKQGFRLVETTIVIRSGEVTRLNLSLEVGAVSEVVTVEASAATLLDVSSAQISTSIDSKTVLDLPNLGRDPVAYATLAPGVAPVSKDNPFLGSGSFNANGQRGRGNNITVDNLHPVSSFLGKLGNPERGGLGLAEFKRRQELHRRAEIAAMVRPVT